MVRRYIGLALVIGSFYPVQSFWDDMEFMEHPRRWMADMRKSFADTQVQGINNCAVSSNDQEIVISLNLLKQIDPSLIKSNRSGNTVTVQVRLGDHLYKLHIKAHMGKLSYSCSVEQKDVQDIDQQDLKSHRSSQMSSVVQQAFPAEVDLEGVSIELDGTMLHVHIPRKELLVSNQEIPLKVKSKKFSAGDK